MKSKIAHSTSPQTHQQARTRLRKTADPKGASGVSRFFKTGRGEYSEGDVFIGVTVPEIRKVARAFSSLALSEIEKLLESKVHEDRLLACLILVDQFQNAESQTARSRIYRFYIKKMKRINNWDLVDASAAPIVGGWLARGNRRVLEKFATSSNLWVRRISIVSTHHFIKQNDFKTTLKIARLLINDEHDLIHKAVGWMLRETWKRGPKEAETFLDQHAARLPRTTLRYAIERMAPAKRTHYMSLERKRL